MAEKRQQIMDERGVERALARMAREIIEKSAGSDALSLIGIHRRGVQLAQRIADEIEKAEANRPPVGSLDITLYRDDLTTVGPRPVLGETRMPADGVDDRIVVIIDDVAYTGRTARAAMDELADFGRPRRILLCVLVDRGGRELPIQPDIVGRHLDVPEGTRVEVLVPELDDRLAVEFGPMGGE